MVHNVAVVDSVQSAPPDWTLLYNRTSGPEFWRARQVVCYKFLGPQDIGATHPFRYQGHIHATAELLIWSGIDPQSPFDVPAVSSNSDTAPSVTTVTPNATVVVLATASQAGKVGVWTVPSGMDASVTSNGDSWASGFASEVVKPSPGATGGRKSGFSLPAQRLSTTLVLRPKAAATKRPLLGVYRWERVSRPNNMELFSEWLGREIELGVAFSARATWDDLDGADWSSDSWAPWVNGKPGRNLVLQFGLLPGPNDRSGPDAVLGTADDVSLQKCADRHYDKYWKNLANHLMSKGLQNAYLRPGHEFDGDWYPWRAGGNEAAFAGCFRRVVQTMHAAQPSNGWKFVWNIVGANKATVAFLNATWPGDAFVENVGIDLYDQSWLPNTYPYPSKCDSACRAARQHSAWYGPGGQLSYLSRVRDFAKAHGKPMSIPEWGAGQRPDKHGGGDNPAYIQRMHGFIMDPANNVEFHGYWDVNAPDIACQLSDASQSGQGRDYMTAYPQSAALFRQLFSK